jgi:hypothetical protein
MRLALVALMLAPVVALAGAYEDGLRFLEQRAYSRAAAAFQSAAATGDAAAERQLGFMYYKGNGFKRSDTDALEWFERAAAHGDIESQLNLAKMYENGLSVPRDNVKSAHWFRIAADGGSRSAQFRIGEIYYLGDGVVRDKAEAVKWWQLATAPNDEVSASFREMLQASMLKIPIEDAEEGRRRATQWKPKR